MKEKIHPKWFEATVVCSCGNTFTTGSTREKLHVEICSACHPFFTGNQKFVDTEGRVEKFMTKYGTVTSQKSKKDTAKAEKVKADAEAAKAAEVIAKAAAVKAAEETAKAAAAQASAKAQAAAAPIAPTEEAVKPAKPKRASKPRASKAKATGKSGAAKAAAKESTASAETAHTQAVGTVTEEPAGEPAPKPAQ